MDNDAEDFDLNEEEIEAGEIDVEAYEKGFNDGFLICEHDPEMAKSLSESIERDGGRGDGFVAGIQEFFRGVELRKSREDELNSVRKTDERMKGRDLNR